ncbi:MAG: caspase family protein [Planctomycetota bacterium]
MKRAGFGMSWILLLAIGCTSLPPLDPFELPEGKEVKDAVQAPDPARLGVAMAYAVEEWANSKEDFGHAVRLGLDGKKLRANFAKDLGRLGLFKGVVEIGEASIQEDENAYLREARRKGLDLLLVLKPTQNRVAYKGHNAMYVPNLILWVLFWFPSWWIADEVFASEMTFEGSLIRVADGQEIHRGSWKSQFECALDDFKRNWRFWGILRIPGALDTGDYEDVGQILGPHALNQAKIKIMKDLTGFVTTTLPSVRRRTPRVPVKPKPENGGTPPKPTERVTPTRRALVIGAGAFRDAAIPTVRYAKQDAENVAGYLKTRGGFKAQDVQLLTGPGATLARVREAVKTFAKAPGHDGDVRILYFAGRGLAQPGGSGTQLSLALHDTRHAGRTQGAFPLADLWNSLSLCKGKVRVILDTSFSGSGSPRGLGNPGTGTQEALTRMFASKKGWAFLYSAGEGGGALELEELSGGIFTHFLVKGLDLTDKENADQNKDGSVTFNEIQQFFAHNITSTVDLLGESQVPFIGTRQAGGKVIPYGRFLILPGFFPHPSPFSVR